MNRIPSTTTSSAASWSNLVNSAIWRGSIPASSTAPMSLVAVSGSGSRPPVVVLLSVVWCCVVVVAVVGAWCGVSVESVVLLVVLVLVVVELLLLSVVVVVDVGVAVVVSLRCFAFSLWHDGHAQYPLGTPVSCTQSRWKASGQLSQHSNRPVSLHTAHVSSL